MALKKKSVGLKTLKKALMIHRRRGERIVFTNGCFDILHAGHVHYLTAAKALGDVLVVGLNSDVSVRRIKEPGRPINTQRERADVLCALASVDYVTVFTEKNPMHLIRELEPDVLVKGADWDMDQIVGADWVKHRGGSVVRIPIFPGASTTKIIRKIIKSYADDF